MQIGQTIWAIDPMKSFFTGNNQFTVGNSYKIEKVEETTFYVQCDTGEFKVILKSWFDEYFSLTPPKEKEGVREYLVLTTPTKTIVVGTFDEHKEIPFDIYTKDNKGIFSYLDETQATQLRDHLTEALNKLK